MRSIILVTHLAIFSPLIFAAEVTTDDAHTPPNERYANAKVRSGWDHYKTLDEYENAAAAGVSEAQAYLGSVYLTGNGVNKDLVKAVKWLTKAAGAGNAQAEYSLGVLYRDGVGVPQNRETALKWFRLAATWSVPDAREALAKLENDESPLILKAKGGDPDAQYALGAAFLNGQSPFQRDPVKAREWFERSAAQHHHESGYELALMYRDGLGVAQDVGRARALLQRAADGGLIKARVALTDIARDDPTSKIIAPQKPAIASIADQYLKAARSGDANAQFALGKLLLHGDGATRDPRVALEWLRKAAESNHRDAQRFLSDALMRGVDVDQDYDEAARWYLRAAQQGDAEAQYMIGSLYSVGLGVKASESESVRWFSAAAKQGNTKAKERLANNNK